MRRAGQLTGLVLTLLITGCNAGPERLLSQAEARWREGNYEDAIRLNRLLYARYRGGSYGARALMNIGNIYYLNLRQLKDAIEAYNKLVEEFPGRPEEFKARKQLAAIYANEIGDLTQAIYEYDRILESGDLEDRAELEYQRARTHFQKGDYDTALRELRHLEESGVSGHLADQVYLKIGNIYQIQKKYEEAASCFAKVTTSPCIDCRRRAQLHLMETYEALFDFDRAIAAIRSLDRTPENLETAEREVRRITEKRRRLESERPSQWLGSHPR
ncbi:MAG: tetratricopeptide repeat protein [Acidobacteria bacterium]|nr:tetratricopeptide repeat protein [Acidobacteriota bacterium]